MAIHLPRYLNLPRILLNRIEANSMPIPWCGCHVWLGASSGDGYGKVAHAGRQLYVHAVVFVLERGLPPEGYDLDHRCRVRSCWWPWHLEPVPPSVNTKRGLARLFKTREEYEHDRWC